MIKIPKEVFDLFPLWEYRCPICGTYVEPSVISCPECGLLFNKEKWRVPPRFLKNYKTMSEYAHKVLAPKLNEKQRQLLFKYFTTIFSDGFESGDFSAWTGTETTGSCTATVVSDVKYQDSYSAKFYTPGGFSDTRSRAYKTLSQAYSTIHVRVYFRTSKIPTANDRKMDKPISLYNSDNGMLLKVSILKTSGGTLQWGLRVYTDSGWITYTADDNTISANTWYCLEVKLVVGNGNGEVHLWVDGTEKISQTGLDNDGRGNCDKVYVGLHWYQTNYDGSSAHQVTETNWVDCVVVADTYIGPIAPPFIEENPLISKPLVSPLKVSKPVIR